MPDYHDALKFVPQSGTKVSPSLHPGMLTTEQPVLDSVGTSGQTAFRAGVLALAELTKARDEIEVFKTEIRADRTLSPQGQIAKFEETARNVTAAVDERVDGLLMRYQSAKAGLQSKALSRFKSALPEPSEGDTVPHEIRSHVARLKDDAARTKFLRTAVQTGDFRTVAAVLDAPPYLSGLDEDTAQVLRADVLRAADPDAAAQMDAMAKIEVKLQRAVNIFAEAHRKEARQPRELKSLGRFNE